jgi:AcrR family transcriptional regulator
MDFSSRGAGALMVWLDTRWGSGSSLGACEEIGIMRGSKKTGAKRKGRRDPERTRANVLRAGIVLFAAHGYDGVSVDRIVAEAGCNKRMLYHYFGSKDGLYVAVLREVFSSLEEVEVGILGRPVSLASAIREILRGYFDFLDGHPEFVSLLMWENLRGGKFLDAHPGLLSKSPVVRRLQAILRGESRLGTVRKLDARNLLLLLYGACFIHFSNRHTLRHTLDLDTGSALSRDRAITFCEDVILRGLGVA